MTITAELLRANRAPAELMRLYETRDARRGRNEPCTCGSGRKWKHCHGMTGGPAADLPAITKSG